MVLSPFQAREGTPTSQEEYRGNYVPKFVESWCGLQIVAPDTPYVAVAGQRQLYFIDTRFDPEAARHIKEQVEMACVPEADSYNFIDEIVGTAEKKNSVTKETTFVYDPVFARVFFARMMNKGNPELKLPEYTSAGDRMVTYDFSGKVTSMDNQAYACGKSSQPENSL